jgi:hypothetical protein
MPAYHPTSVAAGLSSSRPSQPTSSCCSPCSLACSACASRQAVCCLWGASCGNRFGGGVFLVRCFCSCVFRPEGYHLAFHRHNHRGSRNCASDYFSCASPFTPQPSHWQVFLSLGLNGNVLSPSLMSIEHHCLKISGPLSVASRFCYDC